MTYALLERVSGGVPPARSQRGYCRLSAALDPASQFGMFAGDGFTITKKVDPERLLVAQPLLAVRFCRTRARHQFHHDYKKPHSQPLARSRDKEWSATRLLPP